MPTPEDNEFAAAVRRAGVTIPADRWEQMRQAYFSMQTLLKLLDDPLTYADEPATLPDYAAARGP